MNILYRDPRTIAREVPGIFDAIFPQLTSGIVASFNKKRRVFDALTLNEEVLAGSSLQRSMLFELGVAVAENLLEGATIDWQRCKELAYRRQKRFFDAIIPQNFSSTDLLIAETIGRNTVTMLSEISTEIGCGIEVAPFIAGIKWISSGVGDFSCGPCLIEVKCASKRFSAADYRQVMIYWILDSIKRMESNTSGWKHGILINPRRGEFVRFDFDDFLSVIAAGQTRLQTIQRFLSMIDDQFLFK